MKAVVYDKYGPPDVLRLTERKVPEPKSDEVLIRVLATAINPVDTRIRKGELKWLLPGGFPRIPGYDVAGEVVEAPEGSPIQVGQRVLSLLDHVYGGACAEYAAARVSSIAEIPDSMNFQQAAALPLAASTALQSLRKHGRLKSGDRVLITGASGGVGHFAVQIAVALGATVTGVASGRNAEFVRELGASEFIDYHEEDFSQRSQQWDLIFDAAGKSSYSAARSVLAPHGTYVSTEPSLSGYLMTAATSVMKKRGRVMLVRSKARDLQELLRLCMAGKLNVTVAETFPFSDVANAHRRLEKGGFCGKLVVNVVDQAENAST